MFDFIIPGRNFEKASQKKF